jgi:putative aldouronate transport system permease protein
MKMSDTSIKRSFGEKVFDICNTVFLITLGILTLFPILHVLAGSFSDKIPLINMQVTIWPKGFQLLNYEMVLNNKLFWTSFKNTLIIVFVGSAINMTLTVMTAYPLSKAYLKGRKHIILMILITMIFAAPQIPSYLIVRQLKMVNTLWALMIPNALSSFNMILCMTYFRSIPEELFEAARIDGMPEWKILFQIAVPVSIPMIVTLILFYSVGHWNSFYNAMLYISKQNLRPLQAYMYTLMSQFNAAGMENFSAAETTASDVTPEGLKMATIIVATTPIVVIYPFIQKYFIKGVMIGSIKE